MNVKLQWATQSIDKEIMYMARVSNPENQHNESARLLYYCMEEGHTSPFEMASVCMEINTTRDICRQILRHKSFSFQEFSQRYQSVNKLEKVDPRECRLQDEKNRQNSIECLDTSLSEWWEFEQRNLLTYTESLYEEALEKGIAKELARVLLPEGLTSSRIYMSGTMRSWIFYLKQRLHESTQKEHRDIAKEVLNLLREVAPITTDAFFKDI